MGRVKDLPRIPTTGIQQYTGHCIQNASLGGADAMPTKNRKASLEQLEDNFLGAPAKFLKFSNLENASIRSDGNMYGINGVYFYGPEAVGDCDRSFPATLGHTCIILTRRSTNARRMITFSAVASRLLAQTCARA